MRQSWLHPAAEARDAGRKGRGVFATAPIAAGTTVAAFGGAVVDRGELAALGDAAQHHALQIDTHLFLATELPFDDADFVNHSCDPNCGIAGSVLLVAMRDIGAGEELCFDYAMTDSDDYDEFECSCGTELCRGVVTGRDWTRPELQARYKGWFSDHLGRHVESR